MSLVLKSVVWYEVFCDCISLSLTIYKNQPSVDFYEFGDTQNCGNKIVKLFFLILIY